MSAASEPILDTYQTSCCIVGGGPGGAVLALLLARRGVPLTLLEAQKDFDRDFRGGTVRPSVLEIMDQIGLAARLHQLRHVKVYGPVIQTPTVRFSRSICAGSGLAIPTSCWCRRRVSSSSSPARPRTIRTSAS